MDEQQRERVASAASSDGGPTAPPRGDSRSVADLIRKLADDGRRLFREEVQLAKAEMEEKLAVAQRSLLQMVVGSVLLLGSVAVLLVAINRGLTALLGQWLPVDVAVWLAPVALAVLFGVIRWSVFRAGQSALAREGVAPRRTLGTLHREKEWVRGEIEEVRDG